MRKLKIGAAIEATKKKMRKVNLARTYMQILIFFLQGL